MCACEGSFVCARCAGTPFDPRYLEDAHESITTAEFDELIRDPSEPWTFGEQGWV